MIKISSLLLLSSLYLSSVQADTSEEPFKKVFGKNQETKHVVLDATLGECYPGGIGANIAGDALLSLSGKDLEALLTSKVRASKRSFYRFGDRDFEIAKLPFKFTYLASELRIKIELPADDQEPLSSIIYDELIPYYSIKA